VGSGCVVMSYGGGVGAAASSLAMVAVGVSVVVNKVVASSSSSEVGVVGGGVGIGLWVMRPVVWGWRLALAGVMHIGVSGVGWASTFVVLVVVVSLWLR